MPVTSLMSTVPQYRLSTVFELALSRQKRQKNEICIAAVETFPVRIRPLRRRLLLGALIRRSLRALGGDIPARRMMFADSGKLLSCSFGISLSSRYACRRKMAAFGDSRSIFMNDSKVDGLKQPCMTQGKGSRRRRPSCPAVARLLLWLLDLDRVKAVASEAA